MLSTFSDQDTYISKEILQYQDKYGFTPSAKEKHLSRSLLKPTDKISSSNNIFPSGRFIEDFITHKSGKWLSGLRGVGFTVNPEYVNGET